MVLTLEKYSDKSLAIFGDTAPYKDRLLEMGGKYIANLRGRPGWIFFLNMKKTLETFIAEYEVGHPVGHPVVHPAVDTPDERVSKRKDIYSALAEIQTMMSALQTKINEVMDLAEKTGKPTSCDDPTACDPADEDIAAPVSLLRRR